MGGQQAFSAMARTSTKLTEWLGKFGLGKYRQAVMRCSRCQAANPGSARFCGECGTRLSLTCPHCQAEVSSGKSFCWSCGGQLANPTRDQVAPPVAYTPDHLAERILTLKAALEGERKKVTVLFADTKASMELLADRDPEEARKLLDPVLEHMMESVHRYEGTSTNWRGTGSWRYSARHWPTRTMRCGLATLPSTCKPR